MAYEIGKRIPQLLLRPAHVLFDVVRAGESRISIRHSASISEEFNWQYSVVDTSNEVDGKAGVEPNG